MKPILFLLFFSETLFSQLHVSSGSFIFANQSFIFVKNEINLAANSNIFLRNQSQILQGNSSSNLNQGLGSISIFQEGTVNNFQYNYWCSPVGIPSTNTGNSNFGISRLFQPNTLTTSTQATILPFSSLNGIASPLSIAQRWIYTFTTSSSYSQWNYIGQNSTILPGLGFTMKGTSGTDLTVVDLNDNIKNNSGSKQRYDFRGKPNNGDITNLVSTNNFTLIGNPYPSAIDLDAFLLDPTNSNLLYGQAYFWEQVPVDSHYVNAYSGGYGVYTPGAGYTPAAFWNFDSSGNYEYALGQTGTSFERRFTPVGQGFMVRGKSNGSVIMKNSFRVFRKKGASFNSEFGRSNELTTNDFFEDIPNVAGIDYTQVRRNYVPQLRINAMFNNQGIRPATLGFNNNTSDNYDYGFDGSLSSSEAADFYFILNGSNEEFIINVTNFDIDKRIPIGLRCNAQTNFKIKIVDLLYGFDANQGVYIHDILNDTYYDIKNGYFDITLPSGNYTTRFEITFRNNNLSNDLNSNNIFNLIYNNSVGNIIIFNPKNKNIASLEVYDMLGKLVFSSYNLGNNNFIEQNIKNSLQDGVFSVKIKSSEGLVQYLKILSVK